MGFPAVAVTYRNDLGAPRDPSGYHRYGQTEWSDIEAAVRWSLARGARRVVLAGHSMGAGVAAAFLTRSPLAPVVARVVLDAPMLDLRAAVDYQAGRHRMPVIGRVPAPLVRTAGHGTARITAVAVYSASVSALFGISALYHRGTWTEAGRRRLQRLDHAMIFFPIAGTATPAFLLDAPGAFGLACLTVMWTLTLTAAAIHLAWMNAPELLVGGTFVRLGWAAGLPLPWVWIHAGAAPGTLMLAGLLYTAGALSYHRRRPNPYPSMFGYHEVFHAYVCAAAACQYVAIAWFIA